MKYILIVVVYLVFSACDYADIPCMFVAKNSVNERFKKSQEYNKNTAFVEIYSENDNYIITVASDAHIGKTKNFDAFIANSKAINAKAMVLNGDMCNGNDYDYNLLEKHLPLWSEQKYFLVVGNHELYFDGWKYFFEKFGSSTYYFTVKTNNSTDLYISLDSGSGTLGSYQLAWLKQLLETDRNKYRYCIVFTHNNIHRIRRTGSTNPVSEEVRVLTDLFYRYNVNMVIMGHDHVRNVIEFGNTTYITLDALQDANKSASYIKIWATSQKITYEFVAI